MPSQTLEGTTNKVRVVLMLVVRNPLPHQPSSTRLTLQSSTVGIFQRPSPLTFRQRPPSWWEKKHLKAGGQLKQGLQNPKVFNPLNWRLNTLGSRRNIWGSWAPYASCLQHPTTPTVWHSCITTLRLSLVFAINYRLWPSLSMDRR